MLNNVFVNNFVRKGFNKYGTCTQCTLFKYAIKYEKPEISCILCSFYLSRIAPVLNFIGGEGVKIHLQ